MSNEIVKFSNQFNNVALKKFDAVHLTCSWRSPQG